ncbi:MAG: thermonuclease family protein [Deltaproteobacteria bacterium]|jgi:endonuclease YncB( thermonuclease family)|nr:thermonuclease family protein [Deltaproteobacteria bacterium]
MNARTSRQRRPAFSPYGRRAPGRGSLRAPGGVLFLFLLLCLALGFFTLGRGKVLKLDDGDSFLMFSEQREFEKIRLYGIDCPELNQPGGREARAFSSDLIFLKSVTVTPMYRDQYGRAVALVQLPDGRTLNEELIRNGQAWVYPQYCKEVWCPGWQRLERAARQKKLGLWAGSNPVPPWKWRKKR